MKSIKILVLSGAFLFIACSEVTTELVSPPESSRRGPLPSVEIRPASLNTDQLFTRISYEHPGFAGAYINGATFVILVTPSGDREAIQQKVISSLQSRRDLNLDQTKIEIVQYSFLTLSNWRRALHQVDGVITSDVDEKENVVSLTVKDYPSLIKVEQQAYKLGLPVDAIKVSIGSHPETMASLGSRLRPLKGGLEVDGPGVAICSMGIIARSGGVKVLIAAAHCTPTVGFNDGVDFHQNTDDAHDKIGTEALDPAFQFRSECEERCRYSDGVMVSLTAGAADSADVGHIYRTDGPNTGSTEIVGTFAVESKSGTAIVGQTMSKMGRSTGWTSGEVIASCKYVRDFFGAGQVLYCQHEFDALLGTGDSGSPVFREIGAGLVVFHGIAWGKHFSPITGLEEDLGSLAVRFEDCPPDVIC